MKTSLGGTQGRQLEWKPPRGTLVVFKKKNRKRKMGYQLHCRFVGGPQRARGDATEPWHSHQHLFHLLHTLLHHFWPFFHPTMFFPKPVCFTGGSCRNYREPEMVPKSSSRGWEVSWRACRPSYIYPPSFPSIPHLHHLTIIIFSFLSKKHRN